VKTIAASSRERREHKDLGSGSSKIEDRGLVRATSSSWYLPSIKERGLGVRIAGSGVAHLQWPLISRQCRSPYLVGLVHDMIIARVGAPVGKEGDDEPKRINLGAQARQVHLFFSQHFIDIFHGPPSGANRVPKFFRF